MKTRCDCAPCADADSLGEFLSEYASWLCGCGATYMRIEKNVRRIAFVYGYDAEVTVLSGHLTVALSVRGRGASSRVFGNTVRSCGISYEINTSLSALSWRIRDNHISLAEARRCFEDVTGRGRGDGAHVLFLTSLANASFCRLFGGDAYAMAVVFVATMAGFFMKQVFLSFRIDSRVVFFLCALVSSTLSAGAALFGLGDTPDVATATSVLYLVPGVLYINAAADFLDRHYICSFCRFSEAAVLTACLSAGLFVGLWLIGYEFGIIG